MSHRLFTTLLAVPLVLSSLPLLPLSAEAASVTKYDGCRVNSRVHASSTLTNHRGARRRLHTDRVHVSATTRYTDRDAFPDKHYTLREIEWNPAYPSPPNLVKLSGSSPLRYTTDHTPLYNHTLIIATWTLKQRLHATRKVSCSRELMQ